MAGKRAAAEFAAEMAQLNPRGFRNPGRNGTSLVIQKMLAAGLTSPGEIRADRSARQDRKRWIRAGYLDACRYQRKARVRVGDEVLTGDAAVHEIWRREVERRRP